MASPNPIENVIASLLPAATLALPFLGAHAHDPVERAVTVPEANIRKLCKGMNEGDTQEAIARFRSIADDISDVLLLIASKGKVQPD